MCFFGISAYPFVLICNIVFNRSPPCFSSVKIRLPSLSLSLLIMYIDIYKCLFYPIYSFIGFTSVLKIGLKTAIPSLKRSTEQFKRNTVWSILRKGITVIPTGRNYLKGSN